MTRRPIDRTSVLGVNVDALTQDELVEEVVSIVRQRERAVVANVNVHAVNLAVALPWFRDFINGSRIVFCDGFGVKWAARFLEGKQLQRATPPDWFDDLAEACAAAGVSMYFLGTRQQAVEKAARALRARHPGLNLAGVHHGFFDKTAGSPENRAVVAGINALRPDVLVVGFGMPAQELWIRDNLDELDVHVALPVGALFDYLAGEVARAPRWLTDRGLEWLGRLVIEPRRLWRRYVVGNPVFVWRVLAARLAGSGTAKGR